MSYNVVWVEKLRVNLRKSAVISEDFQSHIVQMALAAYGEGLDDGRCEAKGETIDGRIARKRKELDEIR